MTGELTLEKSIKGFSPLANSVLLVAKNGGRMSRDDFETNMAAFLGVPKVTTGGKNNRKHYNKSKFARYFGFLDLDDEGGMILTPRGKILADLLGGDLNSDPNAQFVSSDAIDIVRELFLDSIMFDPFGSYNCGAEKSNSDVDPPKVLLRALFDRPNLTKAELAFLLWGLDKGEFSSYDDGISKLDKARKDQKYNFKRHLKNWEKDHIGTDFKLLSLLANKNVSVLVGDNETAYNLNPDLDPFWNNEISKLSPFYSPLQLMILPNNGEVDRSEWVRNCVLGRYANPSLLFESDARLGKNEVLAKLSKTIERAFQLRRKGVLNSTRIEHDNSVVSLIVSHLENEEQFDDYLDAFSPLFDRIDSFQRDDHGWSIRNSSDPEVFRHLSKSVVKLSKKNNNRFRLPANLNIIGVLQ